jgi:serine/threonine protein kinase
VYESTNEIYIVQELCVGGDLFDRLDEQTEYHYTEANCARLVKQMLSAIRYLHSRAIVHRDLKLENFLFSSRDPDADLKVRVDRACLAGLAGLFCCCCCCCCSAPSSRSVLNSPEQCLLSPDDRLWTEQAL